jgi:hypothetical protein
MFDTPSRHRAIDGPASSGGIRIPPGAVDLGLSSGYLYNVFVSTAAADSDTLRAIEIKVSTASYQAPNVYAHGYHSGEL